MMTQLSSLLVCGLLLVCWSGCSTEEPVDEGPQFAINLMALDSTCSDSGAGGQVALYKVKVVSRSFGAPEVLLEGEYPAGSSVLKVGNVPEGTDIEFTILGVTDTPGEAPVTFGRASDLLVTQDETTKVDLMITRYDDFTCIEDEKPGGAPNAMFSTATALPDGRVLILGGFTKVAEEKGRFEIMQASKKAYIFDPSIGEIRQASTEMNKARGAHAAAFLPKNKLLLVVGGAERVYMDKDTSCFPFYYLKTTAGSVGYTYELFDTEKEEFLAWDDEEWPDEAHQFVNQARRVFPGISVNNDGTALVTGGGQWPSCETTTENDTDYQVAELYRPNSDDYDGIFMESYGALTMKAMRSGHASVLLEIKDKRSTHLFWGGTEDGPYAELYTEATGQVDGTFGVFTPVEFLDANSYKKRPYFATLTPLKDKQFLLVGGSPMSGGKLKVPSAADAYLIDVKSNNKVGISAIDKLEVGRYFHSATTYDNENVVILGGFSSVVQGEDSLFADTATGDIRFFSLSSPEAMSEPLKAKALPRAGHVSAPLPMDCLLLLGGADQPHLGLDFGPDPVPLFAEIYCPSIVCPESLWGTVCYQE